MGNGKETFEEQQGEDVSSRTVVQESWETDKDQRQLGGRKGIGVSSSKQR